MLNILSIAIGGALGALCRVLAAAHIQQYTIGAFPAGTFAVNLIGAFLIGLFWGSFQLIPLCTLNC